MASPASAVFGSNWQAPKSTGFSSTPSSSSSTLFAFGATSNTGTSSAPRCLDQPLVSHLLPLSPSVHLHLLLHHSLCSVPQILASDLVLHLVIMTK
jgi:hypothetical protein